VKRRGAKVRLARQLGGEAIRQSGNTGIRLLQLLEMRLDAVVLRGGFVRTIYAARQAATHGHVMVNGRKVDRPSRRLRPGDVVSLGREEPRPDSFHWPARGRAPAGVSGAGP
jgi:small subunit ribosomal protein S4